MSGIQYAMLGVGGLAALAGVLMLVMRIRTMVSGCKADATVVDEKVEERYDSKRGRKVRLFRPVFEFAHEGKTYRCQSSLATETSIARGSKVGVRYLPHDPATTAERDSFLAFWGFPLGALLFGVLLVAIGVNAR